jgi:threonyl-tRNA synthetase
MKSIDVRLPDGKTLSMPKGSTVFAVAQEIGPGLAQAAIAGRAAGRVVDLRQPLEADVALEIVTDRDADAGDVIRHSAEHVMADAVKRLFPNAQVDAGRSDHSQKFQYDFLVDEPFTPEDVERIEKLMQDIVAEKSEFRRRVVSREEAKRCFSERGEELKLLRLEDVPENEEITLFEHGSFVDLCRGPHVQRTDQIGALKLLETSGSYFRGNEDGPKLQRIYGTAFANKKQMKAHLQRIEDAKERDHRRVGAALGLFYIDSEISPGTPFYLPKGMSLYNGLQDYVRSLYPRERFQEVMTPQLCRSELFKRSGHYQMFKDDMYFFEGEDEHEELGIKATNCPGHCSLFESTKRSYRELPLRFAEFSRLHRNERSGTLTGLARVRSFAQDDGHVFCEPDQVISEVRSFFQLVEEVYEVLGLGGVEWAVSTRGEEFLGNPEDWDVAERQLIDAVESAGYRCRIKPGDAAFYAPKVEADFRDVLGRVWTLGTIQIDMAMPERFGLKYVGQDGEMHQPAMLHRAVLGSLERFIAIYIEHTGGDFPFWLAPVQAAILPISSRQQEFAVQVARRLTEVGIRAHVDDRSETLGFKIRGAEVQKIPLMLVVGDEELKNRTVTPRVRKQAGGGAKRKQQSREATDVESLVVELVRTVGERRAVPLD